MDPQSSVLNYCFKHVMKATIIMTMEIVRQAITFNAELVDESIWLWLTSEQMA